MPQQFFMYEEHLVICLLEGKIFIILPSNLAVKMFDDLGMRNQSKQNVIYSMRRDCHNALV